VSGDGKRRTMEEFRSFFSSMLRPTENGCLVWSGATQHKYGRVWHDNKTHQAHRKAWELKNGNIPAGMLVCHKCDNPPCCNPQHLFLGTDADNVADKVRKGRQARITGDRHWSKRMPDRIARGSKFVSASLSEKDIPVIFYLRNKQRMRYKDIAEIYQTSNAVIGSVIRRSMWRHVEVHPELLIPLNSRYGISPITGNPKGYYA